MFSKSSGSSVDEGEISNFDTQAADWWNLQGEFAPLPQMNSVRVPFMEEQYQRSTEVAAKGLEGASVLDVGCGGGILSEALAAAGASVVAIDAAPRNVEFAIRRSQAVLRNGPGIVDYRHITAEALVEEGQQYDIVVASEVIEHVTDPAAFVASLAALTRPGGGVVITTINRTTMSWLLTIVMAEYILGLIRLGTHSWNKYVKPAELQYYLLENGIEQITLQGTSYLPYIGYWSHSPTTAVNYMTFGRKSSC